MEGMAEANKTRSTITRQLSEQAAKHRPEGKKIYIYIYICIRHRTPEEWFLLIATDYQHEMVLSQERGKTKHNKEELLSTHIQISCTKEFRQVAHAVLRYSHISEPNCQYRVDQSKKYTDV